MPDSASGEDGVPYACYCACIEVFAQILASASVAIHDGCLVQWDFNHSITVFPPKGREEGDDVEVVRTAANVRPIGLKNCDNKLICTADNRAIRKEVSDQACEIQRGFLVLRQLIANVVDVDTWSRIMAALFPDSALPSVDQPWIFLMLEAYGFPLGFARLVRALYCCGASFDSQGHFSSSFCLEFSKVAPFRAPCSMSQSTRSWWLFTSCASLIVSACLSS